MLSNIPIGIINSITGKNKKLSKERLEICFKCDKLSKWGMLHCKACHCPLLTKTSVKDEECILKKW